MHFTLHRNRTIASTCGISIEFKKGEPHLVPPAMYSEVLAAGGVPETELDDGDVPKPASPEAAAERETALFAAFEKVAKRNARNDFTAGGMPHLSVLAKMLSFELEAKERDAAWVKFQATVND